MSRDLIMPGGRKPYLVFAYAMDPIGGGWHHQLTEIDPSYFEDIDKQVYLTQATASKTFETTISPFLYRNVFGIITDTTSGQATNIKSAQKYTFIKGHRYSIAYSISAADGGVIALIATIQN